MRQARHLPALFLGLFMWLVFLPSHAQQMVSVNRAEVNMRAGASTRHEPLWTLERGYPLKVIGRQGGWLQVRDFENDTGWVYRPLTGKTPHHIVKARIVNIRSGPGTNTRVVGKAQYGELLRTVEKRKAWVKVRQPGSGLQGWVSRPLLWGW
jgi:SH3-like domain-containing protein